MARTIEFEFPDLEIEFAATLLEDEEPELGQTLWENLENPTRLFCRHPLSTGYEFAGEGRPPTHPVKTGTQAVPLGRKKWLMTRIPPGSITYGVFGGYGGINLFYGRCTEPLPSRGPVVAKVNEEDMEALLKAGRAVWSSQYLMHDPIVMIARRKEY